MTEYPTETGNAGETETEAAPVTTDEDANTTAITPADGDTGGTVWDAPNQQVVRADTSAPWEEGDGGQTAAPKDEGTTTARRRKAAE